MTIHETAGENDAGRRLDRVLRKRFPDLSLSRVYRMLREGLVLLNGRPAEGGTRVQAGDRIELPLREGAALPRPVQEGAAPGASLPGLTLEVLWEGASLLAVNKPAGLPVHGPGSLETLVCARLEGEIAPSLSFRPGPLHRLDQGTSGVIVFAKSLEGARVFSALLRERRLRKRYLALVEGAFGEGLGPGAWDTWKDALERDPLSRRTMPAGDGDRGAEAAGKSAIARARPLAVAQDRSRTLIEVELLTGRTHQIRVQAALRGHPLAGDRKYGGAPLRGLRPGGHYTGGYFLHAWELEFPPGARNLLGASPPPSVIRAPIPASWGVGKEIPLTKNLC